MVTCTLPGCQGSWGGQGPGPRQRRDTRTWTAGPGRPSAETSSQLLIKRYFLIQSRECFRVCFCKFKDTCHNDRIFKNITFLQFMSFTQWSIPPAVIFHRRRVSIWFRKMVLNSEQFSFSVYSSDISFMIRPKSKSKILAQRPNTWLYIAVGFVL